MIKNRLIKSFAILYGCIAYGQVGINTQSPHPSSALDIVSANKGVLVPRMTTSQRDLIASPATGL